MSTDYSVVCDTCQLEHSYGVRSGGGSLRIADGAADFIEEHMSCGEIGVRIVYLSQVPSHYTDSYEEGWENDGQGQRRIHHYADGRKVVHRVNGPEACHICMDNGHGKGQLVAIDVNCAEVGADVP